MNTNLETGNIKIQISAIGEQKIKKGAWLSGLP